LLRKKKDQEKKDEEKKDEKKKDDEKKDEEKTHKLNQDIRNLEAELDVIKIQDIKNLELLNRWYKLNTIKDTVKSQLDMPKSNFEHRVATSLINTHNNNYEEFISKHKGDLNALLQDERYKDVISKHIEPLETMQEIGGSKKKRKGKTRKH
jgi:hypothetical protein